MLFELAFVLIGQFVHGVGMQAPVSDASENQAEESQDGNEGDESDEAED